MTQQREPLTVGILGGMGPEATVDLMARIVAATPARDDQNHIRLLVDNNPRVPSRIAALIDGDGESPEGALIAMADGLKRQGAQFLAMPCNTAHHYHSAICAAVDLPFLHMPELALRAIAEAPTQPRRVGLLASSALRPIALYEPWAAAQGLELLYPSAAAQEALMALIRAVKAGEVTPSQREAFGAAAADVAGAGAQAWLIACTELSLLASDLPPSLPTWDASQVLAEAIVARALAA